MRKSVKIFQLTIKFFEGLPKLLVFNSNTCPKVTFKEKLVLLQELFILLSCSGYNCGGW